MRIFLLMLLSLSGVCSYAQIENGSYSCGDMSIKVDASSINIDDEITASATDSSWQSHDSDTKVKVVRLAKSLVVVVENDLSESYSLTEIVLKQKNNGSYALDLITVAASDDSKNVSKVTSSSLSCTKK